LHNNIDRLGAAFVYLPSWLLNLPDMRRLTRRWQKVRRSVSVKQQKQHLVPRIQKHECETCQTVY